VEWKRGEMTQTLYAHMNKRKKKESSFNGLVSSGNKFISEIQNSSLIFSWLESGLGLVDEKTVLSIAGMRTFAFLCGLVQV
jgi:hypothetical protein